MNYTDISRRELERSESVPVHL